MSDQGPEWPALPDPAQWELPDPDVGTFFTGIRVMADIMELPPEKAEAEASKIDRAFALMFDIARTERIRDEAGHELSVELLGRTYRWWMSARPLILLAAGAALRVTGE